MVNAIQMGLWFSFMPLLAVEGLRLSTAQIGSVIAVHMLVSSLVQVPSGRLADRVSRRVLIMIGGDLGSLASATVLFARGFVHLLLICSVTGAMGAMSRTALAALCPHEGKSTSIGGVWG